MGGMSPIPAGIYSQSPHGKADPGHLEIKLEPLIPGFPEFSCFPLVRALIHPIPLFSPGQELPMDQSQRDEAPLAMDKQDLGC